MTTINNQGNTATSVASTDNFILQTSGNVTKKVAASALYASGNVSIAKSASFTLDETYRGKIIVVTGDNIDITMPSASAMSDGWHCTIVNENSTNTATNHTSSPANQPLGQQNIRILRAGSDTVNGRTTQLWGASGIIVPRGCVDLWKDSSTNFSTSISGRVGWKDIPVAIASLGTNANDPTESTISSSFMRGWEFTNATAGNEKEVYGNVHLNHDYIMGTRGYLHCHWTPGNVTSTTVCRFGFRYSAHKGHGQQAMDPTGTVAYVDKTLNGTPYLHYVSELSDADAVPATNLEPDSLISVKLFRDSAHANDTLTTSVWVYFLDFHYLSSEGGTINKAPNFFV